MASEREIFGITGPYFLTIIDWSNSHHRRSIAASLVQGVYQLERDRQNKTSFASPWWEFFGFSLVKILIDDHDVSYYGAIFELKSDNQSNTQIISPRTPRYVFAFRGTIKKAINRAQDFKLNLHCILNNIHNSTRYQNAMEFVKNVVGMLGSSDNIWLAGHSLGASIALTIGRGMAKTFGTHMETYLFNPPFMSPPLERIKNEKLKFGLRYAGSMITAGLAKVIHSTAKNSMDPFYLLSSWVPYLFINPADPICSEYCGYFEHRAKMESIGDAKIARLATQHSFGSLVSSVTGKANDAVHLIPTAYLTINSTPSQSFKDAHGIHQWWRRDLQFQYRYYQYKS